MAKWEDNIFGKVAQQDWIDIGAEVPTRPNDPADVLFDDLKTDNLVAYWEYISSEYQIPMMAMFHGFDTEAQTTFRIPIDSKNIEKGLIKVKINQSERLRALKDRGVVGDDALYEYVMNDGLLLADQVITRTKVAKNELLATGKVSIKENNLNLEVDYGVPAGNMAYTINLHPNADVMAAIQQIVDDAKSSGTTITGMMTSQANVTKLRNNVGLQKAINGNIGAGALVGKSAMSEFFNEEFGIAQIITNDLTYGASAVIDASTGRPSITQARYYPQNKITFFATNAGGKLGVGLWGDPPEVDMGQFYPVGGSSVSPYVFISQKMEWDPAVLWTKASGLFMPVLFNPNSLFIAETTEVNPA